MNKDALNRPTQKAPLRGAPFWVASNQHIYLTLSCFLIAIAVRPNPERSPPNPLFGAEPCHPPTRRKLPPRRPPPPATNQNCLTRGTRREPLASFFAHAGGGGSGVGDDQDLYGTVLASPALSPKHWSGRKQSVNGAVPEHIILGSKARTMPNHLPRPRGLPLSRPAPTTHALIKYRRRPRWDRSCSLDGAERWSRLRR